MGVVRDGEFKEDKEGVLPGCSEEEVRERELELIWMGFMMRHRMV